MSAAQNRARLFLTLPAERASAEALACCEAFCAVADVASLLLPREMEENLARDFVELCHRLDVAVLTAQSADFCRRIGGDGVHLTTRDPADVARARRLLGDDGIVGACCPALRHEAMELGEAGADYLGIDQRVQAKGENLLQWWAEMFTVPVVAMHPLAPQDMAEVAALGADFLVPRDHLWTSVTTARKEAEACMQSLSLA